MPPEKKLAPVSMSFGDDSFAGWKGHSLLQSLQMLGSRICKQVRRRDSCLNLHIDSERQRFRSVDVHLGCLRPDGRAASELKKQHVVFEPDSFDPSVAFGRAGGRKGEKQREHERGNAYSREIQ